MGIVCPKASCKISRLFFENADWLQACVRGLIDTDGGLHRHHKNSAQLLFTNKNLQLIQSLRKDFLQLGFEPSNLSLNDKEKGTLQLYPFDRQVQKYFAEIGSHNPKNNLKFEKWVKTGKLPLNRELDL